MSKEITEWRSREGGRTKGRRWRWRDEIEKRAGKTWMQEEQERVEWMKLWRPPASSGMNG